MNVNKALTMQAYKSLLLTYFVNISREKFTMVDTYRAAFGNIAPLAFKMATATPLPKTTI